VRLLNVINIPAWASQIAIHSSLLHHCSDSVSDSDNKASNTFFYQFPNCLAYDDLDDCVEKLLDALKREPEPLSERHVHTLSWEGATERLYKAAGIDEEEWKEWQDSGILDDDKNAARFHVTSGLRSQYLKKLFVGE